MSYMHIPLVIVGSGPSGYTAAIYAARAGHKPVMLTGPAPGGDIATTSVVENFPGFPEGIEGGELIERLAAQSAKFGTTVHEDQVLSVNVHERTMQTTSGDLSYDAVIWATGSEHRKLGLAGEDSHVGAGVSYCATCDAPFFLDEDVIVVGGGDSAAEEALFLTKYAKSVTLLVRGAELRASRVMADRVLHHPGIEVRFNTVVQGFSEDKGRLTGVIAQQNIAHHVNAAGVFIAIGSTPRTELLRQQVSLDPAGYVLRDGASSRVLGTTGEVLPGFFAAGDVIDPTYRQAITAAGSGSIAGMDAAAYLDALS